MVKPFCYIQQISKSVFPIDIALGESIGDLKNAIRNANPVKLAAVDPDQLTLWKVDIDLDSFCGALDDFKLEEDEGVESLVIMEVPVELLDESASPPCNCTGPCYQ